MPSSIHRDLSGPDWPLGFVAVAVPGTPVNFMVNVDATSINAPESATSSQAAEYTARAEEILVQAFKPAANGMQLNTGNIYVVRKGAGGGAGNRNDPGAMVTVLSPGQSLFLTAASMNRNVWSPYRYFIDADNAGDGALIVLILQ
jgi:hypothetical protein